MIVLPVFQSNFSHILHLRPEIDLKLDTADSREICPKPRKLRIGTPSRVGLGKPSVGISDVLIVDVSHSVAKMTKKKTQNCKVPGDVIARWVYGAVSPLSNGKICPSASKAENKCGR